MGADPGPLNAAADALPLAALAAGRWSAWHGIAEGTTVDDVGRALGPPLDDRAVGGMFGGSPTMFQRWGPATGAPQGLVVWFEGAAVVGIEVNEARRDADDGDLPAPDASLESGAGERHAQLVWSARGLVVHTTEAAPDARVEAATVLFALAPFTVDAWMADPLRWWGRTRSPRSPG